MSRCFSPQFPLPGRLAAFCLLVASVAGAYPAAAEILITEVIPNVTTTATSGDIVELFNTGPGSVSLTDWVLSDMDPDPIAGVPQDATFAPAGLGAITLSAGEFAVVDLVDASGTASVTATNYGVRIVAPLDVGSFLGSERDELLLTDQTGAAVDFVAWSDSSTTVPADSYEDLSALTAPGSGYGISPAGAAWAGIDNVTTDAEYYAATVDFSAYATPSTWGGGAIRRLSNSGVFDAGSPDGPAQWEAVPRHRASLGNASDDVSTGAGLRPIHVTDNLETWLGSIESSSFPDRRLAPLADQSPADFLPADLARRSAWQGVLASATAGQWEETFLAASAIGYEVVAFLDTVSGETFHILRERFVPGEPGFTGMGTYVFFDGAGVRSNLVLEVPHPIFDSLTLEQGALAAGQVRPRVLIIAGAHRNNHTTDSICDGTLSAGVPYRISDVSHHPDNFFHTAHVWLDENLPDMLAIQLHGFCCPGVAPHADLDDDCVISNGIEVIPGPGDFTQVWRERIDARNFLADGVDLTTAAVFGDDAFDLGATNNLQGRVTNGVAPGLECNNAAVSASGRFVHIEQDPDVREEPLHILTAMVEVLDIFDAQAASPCAASPAVGCREAAAGKSSLLIQDSSSDAKDRFSWKWSKGAATDVGDFADPVGGSAGYHVCVYDESPSSQPLVDLAVPPGGTCGGKPCWKAAGSGGFAFKDKAGVSDGVTALKLRAGTAGKSKLQVKAAGLALANPSLPLTTPVTVQLLIDDGVTVECWQSAFTSSPLDNVSTKFRARQ